ncbi:MAG: redox-regulated ATPase YchF [Desulfurococcales archaeon]|jgi:ribosome-binding ATPase YchF (GTP1/OBG family)|nr:redox-regulated ATPase YchF [Desulfurococcales archaeon]
MVLQTNILIGIIGKTNVGKSTLFSAMTLIPVRIENRPFVTIEPNIGVGYVRSKCVHTELGLPKCDARNSICVNGIRFIPVKLIDVAGLIKDAHQGRGLGNKFLDDLRQADVLIHVVDAAGSTDEEGRPVKPGTHDPYEDVIQIEREIDLWMYSIIKRDWDKFSKTLDHLQFSEAVARLSQRLSGLSIRSVHVEKSIRELDLDKKKFSLWSDKDLFEFTVALRKISKPIIIAANKADIPEAKDLIKSLIERLKDRVIIPVSAEYELALRKASKQGLIKYIPGDESFEIIDRNRLTSQQIRALEMIREFMRENHGTGVQRLLDTAVFQMLDMIVVYPVEDPNKYTDSSGAILPDALLVRRGTTAREFAYMIHTDLGEGFIYAVNAKNKNRVGADYILNHNDVIKIVSAKK